MAVTSERFGEGDSSHGPTRSAAGLSALPESERSSSPCVCLLYFFFTFLRTSRSRSWPARCHAEHRGLRRRLTKHCVSRAWKRAVFFREWSVRFTSVGARLGTANVHAKREPLCGSTSICSARFHHQLLRFSCRFFFLTRTRCSHGTCARSSSRHSSIISLLNKLPNRATS